ncbi:uncharacterized protein [Rutidosis leptorrhynchoides]|uniref:uncharacterized protein n=1 Tax=Rutidosis leptorrhynchoides TaxID=125765 RepID=UPI003A99BB90
MARAFINEIKSLAGSFAKCEFRHVRRPGKGVAYELAHFQCFSGSSFFPCNTILDVALVVESRVQLLIKVGDLDLSEKSDVLSLIQCLKASIWCGKHLKMTVMSTEESQEEEQPNLFFQLLLEYFGFCKACFSALTSYPLSSDEATVTIVEKFLSEQLNLTRKAISESKRINSSGPEVIKCAQSVIESVTHLCEVYSQAVKWEFSDATAETNKSAIVLKETTILNNAAKVTKCAIERLCEIGILAASDGGSLVTILNVSWKGVVVLLQLCKGALAERVNISAIVMSLVSLVNQSLKCAAEAWSMLKESISVAEARKTFLPVKFYLMNAAKICSMYPCEVYPVYKEISGCVLMILTLIISMCQVKHLQVASELSMDLLEKTCLDLITSFYNSSQRKEELKIDVLEWLFGDGCHATSIQAETSSNFLTASMVEIVSVSNETMPAAQLYLLGRVSLFLSFMRYSLGVEEDVKILIARKLGWFLDILINEDVYSSVLTLQIPQTYGSGKNMELICEPIFQAILHALKTFMVVVSSGIVWAEVETFLLQNFFHPHFMSWEIILELWCFLVQYAEEDLVHDMIVKFCELMKSVASPESVLIPCSALRKLARSICLILTSCIPTIVDWVYNSLTRDNKSQSSSIVYVALVLEGFPLNLLSDNLKSTVRQKTITDYYGFIESFKEKMSDASVSGVFGLPVFALSSSLQSGQVSISDVDMKTLKLLIAISQKYKSAMDKQMKAHCSKLLSETFGIISNLKHLYSSDEMEGVILEIRNLFILGPEASETELSECKPELAVFVAGLGHISMSEGDDCEKSTNVCDLYHSLLREHHWALVHLAIAAFGYFAAHTDCNQLWKFVPQNAALSYDIETGKEADEAQFMSELKVLLEKEMALLTVTPTSDQLGLLVKEGTLLKEIVQKNLESIKRKRVEVTCKRMDIEKPMKRRKLPDEISKGMELLQSGLKMIGNGLSQWESDCVDFPQLQEFSAKFSCLDNTISQLVGLTDAGQG